VAIPFKLPADCGAVHIFFCNTFFWWVNPNGEHLIAINSILKSFLPDYVSFRNHCRFSAARDVILTAVSRRKTFGLRDFFKKPDFLKELFYLNIQKGQNYCCRLGRDWNKDQLSTFSE